MDNYFFAVYTDWNKYKFNDYNPSYELDVFVFVLYWQLEIVKKWKSGRIF